LNIGNYSGMYDPDSDIYITNLLAEFFTGKETPYLVDMRELNAASLRKKPALLEKIYAKYGHYVDDYETSGFWDRVGDAYYGEIAKAKPEKRAEVLDQALVQLEKTMP